MLGIPLLNILGIYKDTKPNTIEKAISFVMHLNQKDSNFNYIGH